MFMNGGSSQVMSLSKMIVDIKFISPPSFDSMWTTHLVSATADVKKRQAATGRNASGLIPLVKILQKQPKLKVHGESCVFWQFFVGSDVSRCPTES